MANKWAPRSVLVTGAGGNLGGQLVGRLVASDWCEHVYALDIKPMSGGAYDSSKVRTIVADLADPSDRRWSDVAEKVDAIVHFAVKNPLPSANWDETIAALDMTANLLAHANPQGCRFVFASSNHTMGGYKDVDWSAFRPLSSKTPPRPGTRYFINGTHYQWNMYGGSKLTGERLVRAKAFASDGAFTGVAIRIGWCMSGNDDPVRINPLGGGTGEGGGNEPYPPEEEARDLLWFRSMWLSHRDFQNLFETAITADASGWPSPGIVVNGVSANSNGLWDMTEAQRWLGHVSQDDAFARLGIVPEA